MRAACCLLLLVAIVGVGSCRHTGTHAAGAPSEDVSTIEPARSAAAAAEPATPAGEPMTSEPVPPEPRSTSVELAHVDFNQDVRPILEARCQPCHFPGGVMYERRPFDRPETITALGTKLFTRIKDDDERRLISEFLAQQATAHPAPPQN